MSTTRPLKTAFQKSMIAKVPSYGNNFFYSLGFLSMISFVLLLFSGVVMTLYGPSWWLTSGAGKYLRSVHLWATQAFVLFIVLHLMIVFLTSGFRKPRRLTWFVGVLMLFLVLAETEFGYALRGDFSSQWRSLQGADFYNGAGLGHWLNPLNYGQIFGIHIVAVPLAILVLLALHYLLVRVLGIAPPSHSTVPTKLVPANHTTLFVRGGVLITFVLGLAIILPSPYVVPTTIQSIARQDPALISKTLVAELDGSSDTATYMDNIDPYTFSTKAVYIVTPYQHLHETQLTNTNQLQVLLAEPAALQQQQIKAASDYYNSDNPVASAAPQNPAMFVIHALTTMAAAGLYEPTLAAANSLNRPGDTAMYSTRFLADTGVLEDQATSRNITTPQYGMIREETGHAPGAWWLAPIGLLNHSVLANDDNGDRDGAIIFGSLLLTMLAFPFIPYVNQLPDKLGVYKLIWRVKK